MGNNEDKITAWYAQQSLLDPAAFPIGIGDDMAQVRTPSGSVLITTDMLLDGTHFDLSQISPEQAGFKAMNVNLSDCAAMATVPLCAIGAVAIPAGFGIEQLKQLHEGVRRAGNAFNCPVIGGDITSWTGSGQRFAINITVLSIPADGVEPVRRNGARAGDVICVTGTLGAASAGKHLTFAPRVREAMRIARAVRVNAMIDISDGLSTDMHRICTQSNVGARIEADSIPLSAAAMQTAEPIASALNDGEDFELLFTLVPAEYEKLVVIAAQPPDLKITPIGTITEQAGMRMVMADGAVRDLIPGGYDHL